MKKTLGIIIFFCFSISLIAQDNQNIETAKLETGSYQVYKVLEKGYNKYVFELAKKKWPVEFFKNGEECSKILVKRVGIIDEFYEADLPGYPAYYLTNSSNVVVTVIDKKIYYYTWTASKGATLKYILSMSKPSLVTTEKEALNKYRRTIKSQQSGSREVRIKENAEIAAKEAEENSLKGKSIKSINIKLVNPNVDAGMFSVVGIGMEVTLTNGKVLKTKNLGGKTPYSDFESTVTGGDFTGGDFKVSNDTREIPGDVISLKVWSKYNKSVSGKLSYPLNYKNNVFYFYQGNGGSGGNAHTHGLSKHGGNGKDGRSVNVTAEKVTVNGQNVTKITVIDAISYKVLSEAKIHIDNQVTLNVSGGNGGRGADGHFDGEDGGNGGDGGNAGSVSVTGSGASQIKMSVNVQGGNAGAGGEGNESYDRRGRSGSRGRSGTSNK